MESQPVQFISTNEACKRLKVTRSQLQKLFPSIPYLYVWKHETRLFPAEYIDAYSARLRGNSLRVEVHTARDFWKNMETQRLLTSIMKRYSQSLASQERFTANETVALLGVGRMTITHWYQSRALEVIIIPRTPKRDRGRDQRMEVFVTNSALAKALRWVLPVM
jgi:hypothetical protein